MRKFNRFVVILTLSLVLPSFAWAAAGAKTTTIDRSSNLRINPIGLLVGFANLTWDIGAGDRFTIGPSAGFITRSSNGQTATGFGLGVESNFFLGHDRFTDSWILSPFLGYAHASNNSATASGTSLGCNIQYGWFYDGGFNIGLGGGIQYISLDYTDLGLSSASGLWPSLTFTLGYSF